MNPQVTGDGSGGAIIAWQDYRSRTNYDIYAQRIDADGVPRWSPNGVAVCTQGGEQENPQLVSDGSGGAIITREDSRTGNKDIYARKVDSDGKAVWTPDGVPICTAADDQHSQVIATDGSNGAIITWADGRAAGTADDLYARRVDSSGTALWAADGVVICSTGKGVESPAIVSDGSGGAIMNWYEGRSGDGYWDIYSQRVDAGGTTKWANNGVAICTAREIWYAESLSTIPDGSGGAVMTWAAGDTTGKVAICAQRISAGGAVN